MMIDDPDLLRVGTELIIDTNLLEFELVATGNLDAKDGVTGQAVYSKMLELWETNAYNGKDFPMYVIGDPRAGMFSIGSDGSSYTGWKPKNDTTRKLIRNIGWSEYAQNGSMTRQYVGVVVGASGAPVGAQFYFQREAGGPAINFTQIDAPNEAIQVFGDATNGDFDYRDYFKVFCRPQGYTFDDTVLADIFETATGAYKLGFSINVQPDTKITAGDASMAAAPYAGVTIAYYAAPQARSIGGVNRSFSRIIQGNNATAEQIYTKHNYLLRQAANINVGGDAGAVVGKTADSLMWFVGDTLYVRGFIDNFNANDINRIVFVDDGGANRAFPFTAAGTLSFDASFVGGVFRLFFASGAQAGDNFGEAHPITVQDAAGLEIAGAISGVEVPFTYAYDANAQRGAGTAGTDVYLKGFALKTGSTKPRFVSYKLTKSVGQTISFAAEADRGYKNAA